MSMAKSDANCTVRSLKRRTVYRACLVTRLADKQLDNLPNDAKCVPPNIGQRLRSQDPFYYDVLFLANTAHNR